MKNVKKLLALVAVSAVFCCTAVFAACATTDHECNWGEWEETTPATCTREGVETRVCADDSTHIEIRKTDPLGHDWGDWALTTSVSCTAAGEETRTCKHDNSHTEKRAAGEAAGHKWDDGEVTTPAGCTEAGEKTFACTVEGCEGTKTETINAAGHKWDDGEVTTPADCTAAGEKTFTCTVEDCGETKTETINAAGHKLTHEDAEPAGCTEDGTLEYWECSVCEKKFSDEDGTTAVTDAQLVDPAAHKLSHVDADPATCTEDGTLEYWECSVCEKKFSDANGKTEVTDAQLVDPAGHKLAAKQTVDCSGTVTVDYYNCSACGKNFEDDKAQNELSLAELTKHSLEHVDADPASCTEDGTLEYWECSECGKKFGDANGAEAVTDDDLVDPAAHKLEHVDADPAGCTEDGTLEYWECSVCEKKFSDENGENEVTDADLVDPAAHKLSHVDAESATCTEDGTLEHWTCSVCENDFADENGETPMESTADPATGHVSLTHHAEEAATCTKTGYEEYWECDACHQLFDDEQGQTEIDEPYELPLADHTYDSIFSPEGEKAATCTAEGYRAHNVCTVCKTKFALNDTSLVTPLTEEEWAANYVIPVTHTSVTKRAVKDATCTAIGYSTEHYYCSKCKSYAMDANFTQPITAAEAAAFEIAKLGHNYSEEWTIDTQPTCSSAGSKSRHCTRCTSGKTDVTAIDTLPHTWDETDYIVDLETTCSSAGSKSYHCSVCGGKDEARAVEIPVDPEAHQWSTRKFILTPSNCVSEGTQANRCLLCGENQEVSVLDVNPSLHNYSKLWTVESEPTCTTAGLKYHACLNEGCEVKGDVTEIPFLKHNYVCSEDGTATCSGCNDTKSSPADAAGKTVNNFVEVTQINEHFNTKLGVNLVAVSDLNGGKSVLHYLDFYADKTDTYLFTFEYLTEVPTSGALVLNKIFHDTDGGKADIKSNAVVTYATNNTRSNVVSAEIAMTEGETLYLYLVDYYAVAPNYIMKAEIKEVSTANALTYGDNTVSVTVADDSTGADSYTFIPDESKKYSITVPEGLSVAMGNDDITGGATYAEFNATKGVAITFSFSHSVVGEYEINIGEASAKVLELNAAASSVTIVGHEMTEYHVADDLAPGKYTITFTGNFLYSRAAGAGKLWFQLNGSSNFDDLSDDTALYLESFANINKEGYVCSLMNNTWTVTLELAAGDIIYLAPDASLTAGAKTTATLNIQLTKAA